MEPAAYGGHHHVRPVRCGPAGDRLGDVPAGGSVPPRADGAGEPVRRSPKPPAGYRPPRPRAAAGAAPEVRRARPPVHLLRLHRPFHRNLPRRRGVRPRVPDPRRKLLHRLQALRGNVRRGAAPRRLRGACPPGRLPAPGSHGRERRHAAASAHRRHRRHGVPDRGGPHRGDEPGHCPGLLRQQRACPAPLRRDVVRGGPRRPPDALVVPPADRLRVPRLPPLHEDDPHGDGNGERLPADLPTEGGASADPEHRGGGESRRRRGHRFLLEAAPLRGRVHQVRSVPGRMPGIRGRDALVPPGRGPEDEGPAGSGPLREPRSVGDDRGQGHRETDRFRFRPRGPQPGERSGRAPPAAPACRRVP